MFVNSVNRKFLTFLSKCHAVLLTMSKRLAANNCKNSGKRAKCKSTIKINKTLKMAIDEKLKVEAVEYLPTPIKSQSDKKEYKVIRLPNQLTALLISDVENVIHLEACGSCVKHEKKDEEDDEDSSDSDSSLSSCDSEASHNEDDQSKKQKPSEKLAGVSLSVRVGSFHDPKDIQGLAHLLEHMVFMGSEKYPVENDFDSFLRRRGGNDNANTDCETTSFYVECQDRDLAETLDKLANFFISPLMKREAIARERSAIESEFQMAFSSDSDRREQLLLSFLPKEHPCNTFTWGNLVTLRDNVDEDVLYERLHAFRKTHYIAQNMCLAIQARLSMEVLEKYAIDYFSPIPNQVPKNSESSSKKEVTSTTSIPFDTPAFKRLYYVEPVKNICQVNLTWALPSLLHKYKSKPEQYVAWLLGHDGKGSLISYLKKKVWALGLTAGYGETGIEHNSYYSLFSIQISLTHSGFEQLSSVLEEVFSYIALLKKQGCQERLFREIQNVANCHFRFRSEQQAAEFVETLSENMHFYAPEHYICGPELIFDYDPKAIQEVIECLSPRSVNVIIQSSQMLKEINYNKTEQWFKTKYAEEEIPIEWYERWEKVLPNEEFHFPEPNIYVTTNFDILKHETPISIQPENIYNTNLMELWYRPDSKFGLPQAFMYYYFISPMSILSAQHVALFDLYTNILYLQLEEECYPAHLAGLFHYIGTGDKGVFLHVNGFNEKLPLLLKLILNKMKNFSSNLTAEIFDAVKEKLTKTYYNSFIKPGKLAKDVRLAILIQGHWTTLEKHAAISGLNVDALKNFANVFLNHIYIQGLVQGNISKQEALDSCEYIIDILKCNPLLPRTVPEFRVRTIPIGEHIYRTHGFNKNDSNSTVTSYYQSGPTTMRDLALVEILIMIIEEPLFDVLRTKEQLGYHVFAAYRDTFGILGISITVNTQANKFSTKYVADRIEEFIKEAIKLLQRMLPEEFSSIKSDLIKLKRCSDIHLKEEVQRNWHEIVMEEYIFNRLKKEIEFIKEIELDELVEWLQKHTLAGGCKANFRKLSIQVSGHGSANDSTTSNNTIAKRSRRSAVKSKAKPNTATIQNMDCKGFNYGADLEYSINPEKNDEAIDVKHKMKAVLITDIEAFNNSLSIYPVNRVLK